MSRVMSRGNEMPGLGRLSFSPKTSSDALTPGDVKRKWTLESCTLQWQR